MQLTVRQLNELQTLIDELYVHHPTGGHLHILLDDQNIDADSMMFCYRWLVEKEGEEGSSYETVLCRAIWHWMALLTHAQRWLWFYGHACNMRRDMNQMLRDMERYDNAEVCSKEEENGVFETYLRLPSGEEYWMR